MAEDLTPVTDGSQGPDLRTDLEILEDDGAADRKVINKDDVDDKKPVVKPPVDASEKKDNVEEDDEPKDKSKEKVDDVDEDEDVDEDVDIDDDEPAPSPEYKEVMKKYPQLFKDFPGLRHDFFRIKAYDKIFTSVDEAREVADQYDGLVAISDALSNGDAGSIIPNLGKHNKAALARLAQDFMPTLYKHAPDVHERVASNMVAKILKSAQAQAKSSGNKNLFHAAAHLSMFLWDKEDIPEVAPESSPELDERKKQLEERERKFFEQRNTEFISDVKATGEKQLRKDVSRGLDPDDVLPEFIKDTILDKVLAQVDAAMAKDEQHIQNMNRLWERAARSGGGKDLKARLIQTYVNRARTLVGPIRRKLVADAIAKVGKKPAGGAPSDDGKGKKGVPGGSAPGSSSKAPSPKDVDWTKTSDLDYLNRNIKTRK